MLQLQINDLAYIGEQADQSVACNSKVASVGKQALCFNH